MRLRRAEELLGLVRMPREALGRRPTAFSGGQRQRIGIARALAMAPEVVIADESVSALDVSVQRQVLDLLDDLQQRLGLTILFITHDLRVAAQVADWIAVMQRGQVVELGPAEEVLQRPIHAYTRALIDAAPGRDLDAARGRQRGHRRSVVQAALEDDQVVTIDKVDEPMLLIDAP